MIAFTCDGFKAPFTVPDDRAGQRTTCPRCKTRLVVPANSTTVATERTRPPAKVVARLVALFVGGLVFIGLGVYLVYALKPNPSKAQVEARLQKGLPPGFEELQISNYERDQGRLSFNVLYRDASAPLGVRFEVRRYLATEGELGGPGWRVLVTGRRREWDRPGTMWLMVEAVFDPRGKVVKKDGLTAAGSREAAYEELARQLALVVHGAL